MVESLSGAEAAALATPGQVGSALGALRFWKPIGIVIMTLVGGRMAESSGVGSILRPLFVVQCLAIGMALLIHERGPRPKTSEKPAERKKLPKDIGLYAFAVAMVLYHAANAPGGVYLGLYMKRELCAPERMLSYAFAASMVAWMLVVWPAGWLADRWGRKPLLLVGWSIMAVRLAFVALLRDPAWIVANQVLDGLGNGLFAVLAAAWVTDRLADPRRSGEAQVIVGSCLVLGSAVGPAVAGFVVGPLGYRGLFWSLAGVGVLATGIVAVFVPETLKSRDEPGEGELGDPMPVTSDFSTTP